MDSLTSDESDRLATQESSSDSPDSSKPDPSSAASSPPASFVNVDRAEPNNGGGSFTKPMHLVASVIMLASLVMVLFNLQDESIKNANTGSRYATIEALVDHDTYSIDKSRYVRTPDKKKTHGHFISSKPPLLPTYGAAVYWVVKKVSGRTIAQHEGVVVWTVSLFTGWLAHLVFLIYFYGLILLTLKREFAVLVTLCAGAFAYLGAAYATAINNHSTGATLLMVGFYYAYRVRNGVDAKLSDWVLSGLVLGVLSAIDLPATAFSGLIGLYLLTYDWKKTLLCFVPAALPGLATGPVLNYISSGYFIPAYVNPEVNEFAGNYFAGKRSGIDALQEPKHIYLFHTLFGHHGFFSMTPLHAFGLYELVRRCIRRREMFIEALVIVGTTLVIMAFYVIRTRNYGGWCVGMRWYVPLMPLFLLYFGLWLDRVRIGRIAWAGVLAAFVVSAYNVQDGLGSPFQFSKWHNLLDGTPNRHRLTDKMNLAKPPKATRPRKSSAPGRRR